MEKDKLLGLIKSKGIQVGKLIEEVNESGVRMSKSTFYKGLRDERPFKADEIKAMAKILEISGKTVNEIFFADLVS